MFNNWIRTNKIAMWLLTVIRVYLGYQWIKAGWEKLNENFNAGGFIGGAIAKSAGEDATVQAWWGTFLKHAALPAVDFFNVLVPVGEFLVGAGLILGTFSTFAVLMGIVMNASYLFSGTVSTNAQMMVLEFFVLVAGANAGKIGLDYYVLPFLRKVFHRNNQAKAVTPVALKAKHSH